MPPHCLRAQRNLILPVNWCKPGRQFASRDTWSRRGPVSTARCVGRYARSVPACDAVRQVRHRAIRDVSTRHGIGRYARRDSTGHGVGGERARTVGWILRPGVQVRALAALLALALPPLARAVAAIQVAARRPWPGVACQCIREPLVDVDHEVGHSDAPLAAAGRAGYGFGRVRPFLAPAHGLRARACGRSIRTG
eukprot:1846096-Rhodomonas_salina.1